MLFGRTDDKIIIKNLNKNDNHFLCLYGSLEEDGKSSRSVIEWVALVLILKWFWLSVGLMKGLKQNLNVQSEISESVYKFYI